MKKMYITTLFTGFIFVASLTAPALAQDPSFYIKKDTWQDTMRASTEALMAEEEAKGGGVSIDFAQEEFTVAVWVRTKGGGPVFVKSSEPGVWELTTKTFYISDEDGNLVYLVSVPRRRDADDPDKQTDESTFDGLAIAFGQAGESDLRDGQWHHIAMTGVNRRYNFYIDGKPIESMTLWNFNRTGPDNPEHSIYAGWPKYNLGEPRPGLTGDLDELQIFSKKLSVDEIAAIYRSPGTVKDGLAGWWSFDDGAKDASTKGNDGEITNGKAIDGKFGKALHLDGEGFAMLPAMPGKDSRDRINKLIGRDFKDADSARQLKWELQDGIWDNDKAGDPKQLALRYATATRDILGLPEKADKLAKKVKKAGQLEKVRKVYYSSRLTHDNVQTLRTKLEHMAKEIDYLQDVHTDDDKKWNDYKASVNEHAESFKSTLSDLERGNKSAADKLAELQESVLTLHDALPHRLPSGPAGPQEFGAVYTKLKYTLEWDRRWRVSDDADVVVQFDTGPYKFVFWRGCSYIPCWATEQNGPWFTNEFFERRGWLGGGDSMMEPMSDKQCRYSHVRVIENNDARVVVHWRYTPCDLNYNVGYIDSETNWSDWADEYWTIYPDGIAMREATLFSSGPNEDWVEYQESIFINQPGTMPSDNIPWDAVTLANLDGETHTYRWERKFPPEFAEPKAPCIQLVNFRTKWKQFSVVTPEQIKVSAYPKDPRFDTTEYFNTWDAWPVSQDWSDARKATNFNKVSHSNLTHITWKP
ncbi:MAG: LamG-like jellyroll fold domain-containing protein, partial [Planctomycetota bacterium]